MDGRGNDGGENDGGSGFLRKKTEAILSLTRDSDIESGEFSGYLTIRKDGREGSRRRSSHHAKPTAAAAAASAAAVPSRRSRSKEGNCDDDDDEAGSVGNDPRGRKMTATTTDDRTGSRGPAKETTTTTRAGTSDAGAASFPGAVHVGGIGPAPEDLPSSIGEDVGDLPSSPDATAPNVTAAVVSDEDLRREFLSEFVLGEAVPVPVDDGGHDNDIWGPDRDRRRYHREAATKEEEEEEDARRRRQTGRRRRRALLVVVIGFLAVASAAAIAGTAIARTKTTTTETTTTDEEGGSPDSSSSSGEENIGADDYELYTFLLDRFQELDVNVRVTDPSSPQGRAAAYMFSYPGALPRDEGTVQLAAAAIFFYATGGDDSWRYDGGWLGYDSFCEWRGITCTAAAANDDDDRRLIEEISLPGNNLTGTLPAEIGAFSASLRRMNLKYNSVGGDIPSTIDYLTGLELLALNSNALRGPVPDEINSLREMKFLDLGRNLLSGSLPPGMGDLSRMENFDVSNNRDLGGIFPSREMTNWTDLSEADFTNTAIRGVVSDGVCDLGPRRLSVDCDDVVCGCCTPSCAPT